MQVATPELTSAWTTRRRPTTPFSPPRASEFVFADTVADFSFPFQMEEEDAELSVNVVNAFEDTDMEIEAEMDVDVPLNELVSGKVRARVAPDSVLLDRPLQLATRRCLLSASRLALLTNLGLHASTSSWSQVNRVEDYGAFITVSYGNKEFKAFLERDEAKVRDSPAWPGEGRQLAGGMGERRTGGHWRKADKRRGSMAQSPAGF